jgi:hypothetical protein
MDSDSRKAIRKAGLVVIGFGLLQALVISSFSHDPAILSLGFGPAILGLFLFVSSFFALKGQPKNPIASWRSAAFWFLTLAQGIPRFFFGYHFPARAGVYILIAYSILGALLLLWPAKHRPEQGSPKPFAGGGVISN